jgi:hypothetical protein
MSDSHSGVPNVKIIPPLVYLAGVANTSCWFALRRRTDGRPIAPVAPAIRILIAVLSQLALRRRRFQRSSLSTARSLRHLIASHSYRPSRSAPQDLRRAQQIYHSLRERSDGIVLPLA